MYHLPKILEPKYETDLIRLGRDNDGGYVVPAQAINSAKKLVSFGLDDDWSFEQSFFNCNKSEILVYDSSVNLKFWIKKNIINIKDLVFLKKNLKEFLFYIFKFFKYFLFFKKNRVSHIKKHVTSKKYHYIKTKDSPKEIKIEDIFNKKGNDIFLKIDIEGDEYKILDSILNFQNKINGIVIEFHSCDLMIDKIKKFLKKLKLDLVHIHVNNFSAITSKKCLQY